MTITTTWCRAAANLFAVGALAALLSACTLMSETNLVASTEAVQPLPPTFLMASYGESETAPGTFIKAEDDEPAPFSLKDGGYVVADGSMTAYFVPTELTDTYLLSLVASDGTMYGVARVRDDIMELAVVYGEEPGAQFTATGTAVPPGVTIVTESGGGVMLADRAALDAMIALHRAGTIKLGTLVVWVGAGAAPATLKRDGDWYVPG